MPSGKQIAAFFAVAALGAGLGVAGHQQVEKQKWRTAVSAIVKPEMVKEFSRDTRYQYDGKQYGRDTLAPVAIPALSKADYCVIDSLTNALADYVSPDPAGLLARAAQEVNNHNEEAAMKRTGADIGRTFEASATSCLAQAKTPAERDHAVAIKNEIGKQFLDYTL